MSVWAPINPRQVLKPLQSLRLKVLEAVQLTQGNLEKFKKLDDEEPDGFEFKFHLDPFQVEEGR